MSVLLAFPQHVDTEAFLDVVVSLGGVRHPDEWTAGQLSRRDGHNLWVFAGENDQDDPLDVEEVVALERKLGSPLGSDVVLQMLAERGSYLLALELIEAVAQRWHLVIDTMRSPLDMSDPILTLDELRTRAAVDPDFIFSDPLPPEGSEELQSWYERMGVTGDHSAANPNSARSGRSNSLGERIAAIRGKLRNNRSNKGKEER